MAEYVTPLMQQFAQLKKEYADCLVLFRLGDFYELFAEDAKIGAAILDITLTRKAQSKGGDIPMAGIPYHALDSYLYKLVQAGHKVAIAEQVGVPDGKTLVERKVIRIVTPGTILTENSLRTKEPNYIITLQQKKKLLAAAIADISTGQLIVASESSADASNSLATLLSIYQPKECVLPENLYNDSHFLASLQRIQPNLNISVFPQWQYHADHREKNILRHFGVQSLAGFDLASDQEGQEVVAAMLGYLAYTQQDPVKHIKHLTRHKSQDWVGLDRATITNLELINTLRDGQHRGSLLFHLDRTTTPMGGRLLRTWLLQPLRSKNEIEERQSLVSHFVNNPNLLETMRTHFSEIGDIERLLARLSVGIGNARDLARLQNSLEQALTTQTCFTAQLPKHLTAIQNLWKHCTPELKKISTHLKKILVDEPSFDPRQGGIIRDGVDPELDVLRHTLNNSKSWMRNLEIEERQKTGISTLKIRSNKVFGFYIEVTNANAEKIPSHYERKQTLVNSERFFTPELKKQEITLLTAEEKSNALEFSLFQELVQETLNLTDQLQRLSASIAQIDALMAFAKVAHQHNYVAPTITQASEIHIRGGRHPVVETLITDDPFVPNDTLLDATQQLHILTGPNMAGKSVYIRQVALITLLAHLGCHVPADSATISLVDTIFVRSGASDVITAGLSTFMVEMVETAYILRNATSKSLIIMDEIGRGTSTYDGISIAQAVAEYIATNPLCQAKTLFATHYHELQELARQYNTIHNFQVAVEDHHGEPIFLHRVLPGGADHSFGVAVAQLAGLPPEITKRAKQKLRWLEQQREQNDEIKSPPHKVPIENSPKKSERQNFSQVLAEIESTDITQLTPMAAMQLLYQLQESMNKK